MFGYFQSCNRVGKEQKRVIKNYSEQDFPNYQKKSPGLIKYLVIIVGKQYGE